MPLTNKCMSFSVVPRVSRRFVFHLFLFTLLAFQIAGQATAKRPLTQKDFDSWQSLQGMQISRDGKFVAYVKHPQDGDGTLIVRNVATGMEWSSLRGYRPAARRPNAFDPAAVRAFAAQRRMLRPVFSADSKFLFFTIEPTRAEIRNAKRTKKKRADYPKKSLGIMDLSTGKVTGISDVKSFQVPRDGVGYVSYLMEAMGGRGNAARQQRPTQTRTRRPRIGTDLVLRRLSDGHERTFPEVLSYSFSKDAETLIYTVSSRTPENNGTYSIEPKSEEEPKILLSGAGNYSKLTWMKNKHNLHLFAAEKKQIQNVLS